MKKITINEIDFSVPYEGYYWLSNEEKPRIVNSLIPKGIFKALPFVIEAHFLNDAKESISVKNIDGIYLVFKTSLKNLPEDQITTYEYLTHKLPSIEKIKTIQYWEESDGDLLLENMKTLIPTWTAFAGFI